MKFDKNGRVKAITVFQEESLEGDKQDLKEELLSEEERSKFNSNFYARKFNQDHPAEPARLSTSANETTEDDDSQRR